MSSKLIQTLVLLLLLVALPLGSWFYLRNGLNYRLEGLAHLTPKSDLSRMADMFELGLVQVIYSDRSAAKVRLDPILTHYTTHDQISFLSIPDSLMTSTKAFGDVWSSQGYIDDLTQAIFLTDAKNRILQCYHVGRDKDLAQLTEDIAFVLPPLPEKDFHFRQEQER